MFCTQSGIVGHNGIIYFFSQFVQLILARLLRVFIRIVPFLVHRSLPQESFRCGYFGTAFRRAWTTTERSIYQRLGEGLGTILAQSYPHIPRTRHFWETLSDVVCSTDEPLGGLTAVPLYHLR